MDGNRRLAKRLMQQPWKGHEWGAKKFQDVLSWCLERGVEEVTVYAFSMQNFDRPKEEFDFLMENLEKECDRLADSPEELVRYQVRVRVIGRTHLLPEGVRRAIRRLEETTAAHSGRFLNIALAYGGREELLDAFTSIAEKVRGGQVRPEDISVDLVSEHLYMPSEPDLIIRTGGEHRTSNFLPWQSWYSEWCFVDALWPEFSEEDFEGCLERFAERERRYGR